MLVVLTALGWEAGEKQRKAVRGEREERKQEQSRQKEVGEALGFVKEVVGDLRWLNWAHLNLVFLTCCTSLIHYLKSSCFS